MNPGATFVDRSYDPLGHLWIVLSAPAWRGRVAVVNLTSHNPERRDCGDHCLILGPGDHPFVRHESCVYYKRARLRSPRALRAGIAEGGIELHEPLGDDLLFRIQQGALASQVIASSVRAALLP